MGLGPEAAARKMCQEVKVRNYHIDSYGHVNNAQYLRYLEDARTDFFENLGLSIASLNARNIHIFITETNLRYRKPARVGDKLLVYGWFVKISSRKATWQHEIFRKQDNALILTGQISGMFLKEGRLTTIPQDVRTSMLKIYIS